MKKIDENLIAVAKAYTRLADLEENARLERSAMLTALEELRKEAQNLWMDTLRANKIPFKDAEMASKMAFELLNSQNE